MSRRPLLRTWTACLIGCLPLLAVLLVPQLMRSRAGSEQLLFVGTSLLLVLLVLAFTFAPVLSAWLAPQRGHWTPSTARRSTGVVWRERPAAAIGAILIAVGIYAAGQVLGYGLAEVVPSVGENPARAADPQAPAWVIHYPAYALQAVLLYLTATFAVAVYAWRMRSLHLSRTTPTAPADARVALTD